MTDEHTNKHIQSKARHSECKAATFFPPNLKIFEKCSPHGDKVTHLHVYCKGPQAVKFCCVEQCFGLMHTSTQDQQEAGQKKNFSSLEGENRLSPALTPKNTFTLAL